MLGEWETEVLREFHIAGQPLSFEHIKERTSRPLMPCVRTTRELIKRGFVAKTEERRFYHSWTQHYYITPLGIKALFRVEDYSGKLKQLPLRETNALLEKLFSSSRAEFAAYRGVNSKGELIFNYDNDIIF